MNGSNLLNCLHFHEVNPEVTICPLAPISARYCRYTSRCTVKLCRQLMLMMMISNQTISLKLKSGKSVSAVSCESTRAPVQSTLHCARFSDSDQSPLSVGTEQISAKEWLPWADVTPITWAPVRQTTSILNINVKLLVKVAVKRNWDPLIVSA